MKKLTFFLIALMAFMACSKEQKGFNYRGLAFSLPTGQMIDSMLARGYAIDSAHSDSGRTVLMVKASEPSRVIIAFDGDQLQAIQESYAFSTNDSTRRMWQELRDGLEKELGAWPDCPILKDDHKQANFDATDGFISVILENTYTPTLKVVYRKKR